MIDCPLCKDVFETGHEALEHCKSAHPELYNHIKTRMPSLIEVNRMAATKPAIEIKPLPGTTVSMDIKEPYSPLGVLYAVLAIMVVGTFIMILLHRNGVI